MFYSIPVNNEQIITTSPLEARSITHVFFESKNDGIFNYKRDIDKVTITVDGKLICRDVPILPFTSSTTYGINRHKWQDVALEVGLNVNLSEIKISAQVINDFNVVFVCSNTELKETKGFDFVEYKKFTLKEELGAKESEAALVDFLSKYLAGETVSAFGSTWTKPYQYIVARVTTESEPQSKSDIIVESTYSVRINNNTYILNGAGHEDQFDVKTIKNSDNTYTSSIYYRLGDGEHDTTMSIVGQALYDDPYSLAIKRIITNYATVKIDYSKLVARGTTRLVYVELDNGEDGWINAVSIISFETKTLINNYFYTIMRNNIATKTIAEWGKEQTIALDRAPQMMFFSQYKSESEVSADKLQSKVLQPMDVLLNFTLSGTEEQEFDPGTDMSLFMTSDTLGWRNCAHTFQQVMPRVLGFTYNCNGLATGVDINELTMKRNFSKGPMPKTWDLYAFFVYKKLL